MNKEVAKLWSKLSNIPVNDDGLIEEEFLGFPVGTDREEIWMWLEETNNVSVAELMYKGEE